MNDHLSGPPADFLAKMQPLLGAEFAQFAQSFDQPRRVGLRVNTLKVSPTDFSTKSPFVLTPAGPHEPAGFLLDNEAARPGSHPYHAAGLYYLQEPAAMMVGGLVQPQPGEWVLDLAAAPGGKTTHLAARMGDTGLLVANDVHQERARLLAQNLERWGTRHTLITNDTPERLAAAFGPLFDRVLVDAPCSGEGLFRRLGRFEWSTGMVAACARRQGSILATAAALVRPGGLLVYATCTFSPEENEQVMAHFLADQPGFRLIEPAWQPGFDHGRPLWASNIPLDDKQRATLSYTIRLWPHLFPGEGHFMALLRKEPGLEPSQPALFRCTASPAARRLWRDFAQATLPWEGDERQLHEANGRLYHIPANAPATGPLRLVRYGLLLGELGRGHFRPAHTLALALTPGEVAQAVDWPVDDSRLLAYLAGHDMPDAGPDGWVLVTVTRFALGWGKRVNGRLKNHYPRGLRLM